MCGKSDQPRERRMRRASLAGKLRDQAFDGGVGMAVDPAQIELAHDTASRAIAGEPGTARADCRADGRMKQRLGSPRERRAIAPAPSRRPSREHSNTSAMAA